jgi:membrane protease YdiL (CAAX protease family)
MVVALLSALVVAGIGLVGGTLLTLGVLLGLRATVGTPGIIVLLVVSLVLTQGVAFGGPALAFVAVRRPLVEKLRAWFDFDLRTPTLSLPASVPTLRDGAIVLGGWLLAFGLIVVAGLVVQAVGVEPGQNQVAEIGFENPEALLLLIPASFLLIGPGEELLFRGVVQGRIREAFGPVPGIALASAIFAAIHYFALTGGTGGRLVTIAILFLPSVVFGVAYELSENLVVPSLIHGAYNATLFTLLYVVIKLTELSGGQLPAH